MLCVELLSIRGDCPLFFSIIRRVFSIGAAPYKKEQVAGVSLTDCARFQHPNVYNSVKYVKTIVFQESTTAANHIVFRIYCICQIFID
jgi:hypothetical protein